MLRKYRGDISEATKRALKIQRPKHNQIVNLII